MAAAHGFLRQSRLRLFAILALLAAFTLLVGAHRAAADAAHPATTTTLTASPSSVVAGQPVTLTATVTGTGGAPTGIVDFYNNTSSGRVQLNIVGPLVWLVPIGPNTSQATWTWYPAFGSYIVSAVYTSTDTTNFQNSTSSGVAVAASSDAPHNTAMVLTADPTTIQAGGSVSFKAVVTETDGPAIPTGTVVFSASDSTNPATQTTLGQATLDANGVATLSNVGGWAYPVTYIVNASYSGDVLDNPVGSSLSLPVTPAPPTDVQTTTTVTATPSQIAAGDTVTLVAHVSQVGNPTPPPAGDAVDFRSTSIFGTNVELGTAPLQADGTATITVTFAHAADYSITASYVGDITQHILGSTGTATISVNGPRLTTTAYTGPTSVYQGSAATLSARLTDSATGSPIAGESLAFTIGGGPESCSATTDATGAAGSYPVHVAFAGDANHLASSATGTITVVPPLPTSLTYTGDTTAVAGGALRIAFKLTDANGAVVPNEPITMTMNGQTYSDVTDENGIGDALLLAPATVGSYTVSASFAGDAAHLASIGTGAVNAAVLATTLAYNGDTQAPSGGSATLAATLLDTYGNPLAGKTVTLTLGTGTACSGTTDAAGHISCSVIVTLKPGSYSVLVTFAGDTGYLGSITTSPVTIFSPSTIVRDGYGGPVLSGSTVTATGTLLTNTLAGIQNRTLTLSLGGQSCTGITNASGVATCPITVTGPLGPTTTSASFAGDTIYKAGSDSKPALVYADAPGGGAFVVGDKTATGSVTYWGSQWWKKNVLSAGNAQAVDPGAFKGYAATPGNPQCGGTWSTASGNSSPPPAGPLPAYMAVIVTSQNAKAPGPVISGNIVHVVVVKTNAGYDGNPGHAGTGTVVATVC